MATDKTVSFPVRLPTELDAELQRVADTTGISKQDLMRLCLRIGLVDLRSIEHNLAGIIKQAADDKGLSFQRYAENKASFSPPSEKSDVPPGCADSAASTRSSPPSSSPSEAAKAVMLPPPPMLGTVVHDGLASPHSLNESSTSQTPTEPRREIRYSKPNKQPRRKNGTED